MTATEGMRKLLTWLAESSGGHRRTRAGVAETCGVSGPAVSAWARGVSRPEPQYRKILESLCGIAAEDWLTDDERAEIGRAMTRLTPGPVAVPDGG